MKALFTSIVGLITTAVVSWIINCGLLYLACFCFEVPMTLRIATGIWLVQALIKATFKDIVKVKID